MRCFIPVFLLLLPVSAFAQDPAPCQPENNACIMEEQEAQALQYIVSEESILDEK